MLWENRSEWKHLGIMRKAQENRRKWLSPEAASRCHNDPALRTPVLPPGGGSRNVQPIAVITTIIGYQLYRSECVEEKTQAFLFLFCYLYTDTDQMRVESNIVYF